MYNSYCTFHLPSRRKALICFPLSAKRGCLSQASLYKNLSAFFVKITFYFPANHRKVSTKKSGRAGKNKVRVSILYDKKSGSAKILSATAPHTYVSLYFLVLFKNSGILISFSGTLLSGLFGLCIPINDGGACCPIDCEFDGDTVARAAA